MQEIYINLDDSGKLTSKEKISAYGGLCFFSKEEKDKFVTQYRQKDGLMEELAYGISNYNYGSVIPPIIFSELKIDLTYQNSASSYVVQAADMLAGTIRALAIEAYDNNSSLLEAVSSLAQYVLILP